MKPKAYKGGIERGVMKGLTPEERSALGRKIALSKWSKTTKEERKAQCLKMQAGLLKRRQDIIKERNIYDDMMLD